LRRLCEQQQVTVLDAAYAEVAHQRCMKARPRRFEEAAVTRREAR
jgi:hypothetical protein